jgi:AcrR family transcriptional regulator
MTKIDGRRLRALETRRRILDASMRLFTGSGYGMTTIEAVAQEAGVAVQTVYFTFGNKLQILKELIDLHVAGDEDPVPTLERPAILGALSAPDPREQIRLLAQVSRGIQERVAPVLDVLRAAAVTNSEAAQLWQVNKEQRRTVQRHFVETLARRERAGDDVERERGQERLIDICYALLSPELYHLLVVERGWSPEQWEEWTYGNLCQNLLDPA